MAILWYMLTLQTLTLLLSDITLRQVCNIERHEFYELVLNYFKARNNMLAIRADIDNMQTEYTSLKEKLWTTTENFMLAKVRLSCFCGGGSGFLFFSDAHVPDLKRALLKLCDCHIHICSRFGEKLVHILCDAQCPEHSWSWVPLYQRHPSLDKDSRHLAR